MLSNQIHTEPTRPRQLFPIPSALAGLRLRAGSPYTPPFGSWGTNTVPKPQAAEWVARDQSLLQGVGGWENGNHSKGPTGPEANTATIQSQGHSDQRGMLQARGITRPRCRESAPRICSFTHLPHVHIPLHASRHVRGHTHAPAQAQQDIMCSPAKGLSRKSLSTLAGCLHPSRHHRGKELQLCNKEGRGRQVRGQGNPVQEDKILTACPKRCSSRQEKAQGVGLSITVCESSAHTIPPPTQLQKASSVHSPLEL